MRPLFPPLALAALLSAASAAAQAECYADYKAKRDSPLRLHYGVIELRGPCERAAAKDEVGARLAAEGWTLLNVVSVFGPEGLDERRENAGNFYLRF